MKSESKIPIYYSFIFLILIISSVLTLFLPYRIVVQHLYLDPYTSVSSGFQFILPYGAILLMIITGVFAVFSRKKVGLIMSLIFLGLYTLYMLFLYAALNFILSLGSPPSTADAGLGYYLLVGISIIFILLMIITYKKNIAIVTRKMPQKDLLDDF